MDKLKRLQTHFEKLASDALAELCERGEFDRARMYARALVALTVDRPEEHAFTLLRLGMICEREEDFEAAALVYGRALTTEPQDRNVWYFLHNNLGYSLVQLSQFAEAEWYCRQAIEIDPARHNAHKNLGLALVGQSRFATAAHCLLEADRRCPGDGRARRHLIELVSAHPELLLEDLELAAACRAHGAHIGPVGAA